MLPFIDNLILNLNSFIKNNNLDGFLRPSGAGSNDVGDSAKRENKVAAFPTSSVNDDRSYHRTKVLSIQSHVVHGAAGNSAASFPMQVNSIEVDTFNVLSFSNHTGYANFRGHRITREQFKDIAHGLALNNLVKCKNNNEQVVNSIAGGNNGDNATENDFYYDYVISGYVGQPEVMREMKRLLIDTLNVKFVTEVSGSDNSSGKSSGDNNYGKRPLYICDPVMGDCGHLYVSEECVSVYKNELLLLADMAFPNGFEASILMRDGNSPKEVTMAGINSVKEATAAADWFHDAPRRVNTVVIKSFSDPGLDPDDTSIFVLLSTTLTVDDDDFVDNGKEKKCQGKEVAAATSGARGSCYYSPKQIKAGFENDYKSPGSTRESCEGYTIPPRRRFLIKVKKIEGYFCGTGDVFLALFISHFSKFRYSAADNRNFTGQEIIPNLNQTTGNIVTDMLSSVIKAAAGVVGVLQRTVTIRESRKLAVAAGTGENDTDSNNNVSGKSKEAEEVNKEDKDKAVHATNIKVGLRDRILISDSDDRELMIVHSIDHLINPYTGNVIDKIRAAVEQNKQIEIENLSKNTEFDAANAILKVQELI